MVPGLLGVAAVWFFVRREPAPSPNAEAGGPGALPPVSAVPAEIALLEGLKPGDVVDEWTVERILVTESPTQQPQLAIELGRKGSGITIWVHRKETVKNPPLSTERYAFTFGHPRPYGDPIPKDAYAKTMAQIAERVRRAESTAPVPDGL